MDQQAGNGAVEAIAAGWQLDQRRAATVVCCSDCCRQRATGQRAVSTAVRSAGDRIDLRVVAGTQPVEHRGVAGAGACGAVGIGVDAGQYRAHRCCIKAFRPRGVTGLLGQQGEVAGSIQPQGAGHRIAAGGTKQHIKGDRLQAASSRSQLVRPVIEPCRLGFAAEQLLVESIDQLCGRQPAIAFVELL